ncbi:MAG: SRPBCC family protein [Nocardioides sp.]|nr:SRPBCC family protein [Nocardioides sp.]
MRLDHSVSVPAKVQDVWRFLEDTHAVVACMPGAELTEELDRDNFKGQVRISIGPLAMNYNGDVTVVERDGTNHQMRIDAAGKDRRGSGTARAAINLTLEPAGEATKLSVVTDVQLTGRIASLGRGVRDVSNKLFSEFADELATQVGPQRRGTTRTTAAPTVGEESGPTATPSASSAAPGNRVDADKQIKIAPLVWSVTRQRLADFLARLSDRVRPRN